MAAHPYCYVHFGWYFEMDEELGTEEGWPPADSDAPPYERSRSNPLHGGATPATDLVLMQPEQEEEERA